MKKIKFMNILKIFEKNINKKNNRIIFINLNELK